MLKQRIKEIVEKQSLFSCMHDSEIDLGDEHKHIIKAGQIIVNVTNLVSKIFKAVELDEVKLEAVMIKKAKKDPNYKNFSLYWEKYLIPDLAHAIATEDVWKEEG